MCIGRKMRVSYDTLEMRNYNLAIYIVEKVRRNSEELGSFQWGTLLLPWLGNIRKNLYTLRNLGTN